MDRFQTWVLLRDLSVGHLPKHGDFPGVYVLRDATTGETLKIGAAGCVRSRVFCNFLSGFGGTKDTSTTQRLHKNLFVNGMIDRVEIAWFETTDRPEALRLEGELRTTYKQQHGKRPVWDLNG